MAGIDKIYGTTEQYDEFHTWCKKHKRSILKHFYPRDGYDERYNRPITNYPMEVDKWLLENCPIKWVTAAIRDQYNLKEGEMIEC